MSDQLRINFAPKYLPVLDLFKAKIDIRYYLCGVYVEKAPQGGVYLVSTDGHTMAVVYDKEGLIEGADNAIVTVDPGLVGAARKGGLKKIKGLDYKVTVRGTRAMVAVPDTDGLELFIQPGKCVIEGKFPAWRKVLPNFEKLKQGALAGCGVNALYMARFCKIPNDKRYCGISLWQEAPEKAVVVQVESLPEAVFIVMPMREIGKPEHFKTFAPLAEEPTELETMA